MKVAIGWLIGLVFGISASAEPLLEGQVRLDSGEPVADAQVRLFDMTDLQRGAIARALTDGTGYFALPLAALTGRVLPERFALGPNYPNPFNPSTIIPYQLTALSEVRLEVFNLLGQRIATLVDGERPAGFHTATWHATDAAGRAVGAGVYIYRMTVGAASQTGRMVLIDGQAGVAAAGAASGWPNASLGGGPNGEGTEVYGLIVSGEGLVPYMDSAFRVEAGMAPVELVVSAGPYSAGKAADDACALCGLFDTFNDQQEDEDETEEEAAGSEDVPEDFLIPEPSQPPRTIRENFELTSFYQQWIDVEGYPVLGSENVNPYALKEAAWLIRQMMRHRPDVLRALAKEKARFSVLAYNEGVSQLPEHSKLGVNPFIDLRLRGLGGHKAFAAEENLLDYPGAGWRGYSVTMHEFAHAVHQFGMGAPGASFDNRLKMAFDAAIAKGLWKDTYASTNKEEYWAEGALSWFDGANGYRSRSELKNYDPALAKLLAEAFGDTDWRYTPPATRTHLPHLQGFDPQDSPTFEYPPELVACFHQLFDPNGSCSQWVDLEPHDPSQLSHMRSPSYETESSYIYFVNQSGADVFRYLVAADGTEISSNVPRVRDGSYGGHLTRVGDVWLIKDENGNKLAVFKAEEKPGRAFIGPVQAKPVAQESILLPDVPQLQQNAPNPFNSQTILSYFLPTAGPARVDVFALTGQRVATLRQGPQAAGHHQLHWNGLDAEGRPLASGIYLYRLTTDFGILTRKLSLIR